MDDELYNWSVLDLLLNTVKQGYDSIRENPAQLAELDQNAAKMKSLLKITNLDIDDFSSRDLYMLLYSVCMVWFMAIKSHEYGKIDRETLDSIYTVMFDVTYGTINAIAPILMKDLREYINYEFFEEEDDDWDDD
jgi:hypothetical protein